MKKEKALTLKTLNKSNVWDIQENDVFRLWEMAERDSDLKDNQRPKEIPTSRITSATTCKW